MVHIPFTLQRNISKVMGSSINILAFLHRLLDSDILGLVTYFCYSLKSLSFIFIFIYLYFIFTSTGVH